MYPPGDILSKFNIFLFTNYEYILFLDADNIFYESCDSFIENNIQFLKKEKKDIISREEDEFTHNNKKHKTIASD